MRTSPHPPLEWTSFLFQVTAVFVTPKDAESPGSGRISRMGVIDALVYFFAARDRLGKTHLSLAGLVAY